MTVAAGFTFTDGLLFCADTKVTDNPRRNETKLFGSEYSAGDRCATLFALAANDFDLAKTYIRECEEKIEKMNLQAINIESLRNAVESSLAKFYKAHIFSHPDRKAEEFQLLIGISMRGETRMYTAPLGGTRLNRVQQKYECIGEGAYLAKYLIKRGIRPAYPSGEAPLDELVMLAGHVLNAVMNYDEYCGGEAEYVTLSNDGTLDYTVNRPLYPGENFPDSLESLTWNMFRELLSIKGRDKFECEMVIEDFCREVKKLNESQRDFFDYVESKIKEQGKPDK